MLRLKKIVKDYIVADSKVHALKGIDLSFRKNEFVSILGPSGCGKTTLLNIVGGLDKYTSGDLFINGKSTKEFRDRDWDVYRNHRVGFIFQSYNLIPHQTILGNVELALTIAGLSKEERIKKAKLAIDRVGLKGQYYKKPNQLSGGQCQRIAIARALVNEPEILLADEPTGALDTVTSVQIMDLIKEISKEKLVIMVTHNPELALKYSSRIVKLLDGEVLSDSNPYSEEEEIKEVESNIETNNNKKKEKAKMSLWTAFKLSLRNLLSKRGRTILTCFAGSIGIIGVSSVLAVSSGVKGYIKSMQDDMLSGNPITIQETALDISGMMNNMTPAQKQEIIKEADKVNVEFLINQLLEQYETIGKITVSNNITEDYIEYIKSIPSEYAACVRLDYGLDMTYNIYTDFLPSAPEGSSSSVVGNSLSSIRNNYASVLSHVEGLANYASFITNLVECFKQAPNNVEYISSQYNVLSGKIATEKNEVMIVLDKDSQMTDLVLAELGYFTQDEFIDICIDAKENPKDDHSSIKNKFTYDEILGKTFRWYPNDAIFTQDNNPYDMISYNYLYDEEMINEEGLELKVVGILEPKETINYGCLTTGFYYTEALTNYALEKNLESEIVKYIAGQPNQTLSSGHNVQKNDEGIILYELDYGAIYKYSYVFDGILYSDVTGYVGNENMLTSMMGMMGGSGVSMSGSKSYSLTLRQAGGNKLANSIAIYPTNFELKDGVTEHLDAWNLDGDITIGDKVLTKADREKITYTDSVGLIITMVNTLINIITYALIAFTALALVVSCVMIAIITYVSVMERVKEIGVIRSLGGRKKDVSNLFNAETFIIGLSSGVFGIGITYLIQFIANAIIGHLSGVYTIADLPINEAITMIILSIVLTCISGLIPAKSAAKKDPVVALRTE